MIKAERRTIELFVAGMPLLQAAREDAINRGLVHFEGQDPSPTELQAWGESLRESAPHFFAPTPVHPQAPSLHTMIPDWLSPSEKLARARQMGLVPQGKIQPAAPLVLTKEQQAELAKLEPATRLATYRQWQAEA